MGILNKLFGPQLSDEEQDKLDEYKIEAEQEAKVKAAQAKVDKEIQEEIAEKEAKEAKFEAEKEKIKKKAISDSIPVVEKVKNYINTKIEENKTKKEETLKRKTEEVVKVKKAPKTVTRQSIMQRANVKKYIPRKIAKKIGNIRQSANTLNSLGMSLIGNNTKKVNFTEPFSNYAPKNKNKRTNFAEPYSNYAPKTKKSNRVNFGSVKKNSNKTSFVEPNIFGFKVIKKKNVFKTKKTTKKNTFGLNPFAKFTSKPNKKLKFGLFTEKISKSKKNIFNIKPKKRKKLLFEDFMWILKKFK